MRTCAILVILGAVAPCLPAADKAVFEIDWAALRQRIGGIESQGKVFHIDLLDGRDIKARLVRVEDNGLVLSLTEATRQWAVSPAEARIPPRELAAIQRTGRRGYRGRLIGTLAGAAIMGLAVAFPGKRIDSNLKDERYTRGQAAALGSMFIPLGFLLGWGLEKPFPELRPLP